MTKKNPKIDDINEGQIPNINSLVKETRLNNPNKVIIENTNKVVEVDPIDHAKVEAENKFKELLIKVKPYFDESIIQLNKAKSFGINSCCIKCEDREIVGELMRQYLEAKYSLNYSKPNLIISWPS